MIAVGLPPVRSLAAALAVLLVGGQATLAASPVPPQPVAAFDGTYGGSLSEGNTAGMSGTSRLLPVNLRLVGTSLSGQIDYPGCGAFPVALAVSSSGEISGTVRAPDTMACLQSTATASGRVVGSELRLEILSVARAARGTLTRVRELPVHSTPGVSASPAAGGTFYGFYAGALATSSPGGAPVTLRVLATELRVSGNRLTGQLVHPACGATPISLPVEESGAIDGRVRFFDGIDCALHDADATGKVSGDALTLDIRGINMKARGSLSQRTE
jgi:hypothetical protein